jgi:sugar phosphate isomerase/epimerase
VDEVLLQDNKRLDMKRVKQTLDKMGWKGWLVVERSRDVKDIHNIKLNYGSNIRYLHSVFTD